MMFGASVAPPAGRLDPAHQAQSPVISEHAADARVPDSMRLFVGGIGVVHSAGVRGT